MYVAKVSNASGAWDVVSFQAGQVSDIPEADRANWRLVENSQPPQFDPITQSVFKSGFNVSQDGLTVSLAWTIHTDPAVCSVWALSEYAKRRSYEIRISGYTLPNGVKVDTTAESIAMINGAIEALERGWVEGPVPFAAMNGFVEVSLDDLKAIAAAVAQFTQGSFARRVECLAAIEDGKLTTKDAVNAFLTA